MSKFKNREDAAYRLAEKLSSYRGHNPLVLAVPRGAVPMGKILAERLEGELDLVLVHKIGVPGQEELALGAVDEGGDVYVNPSLLRLGISKEYIRGEKDRQLKVLQERRAAYTPFRPPIDPAGRIVVVVDDGIATGATMIAALHTIRAKKPAKLIVAIGVAPPETLKRLRREADEVICLYAPEEFYAVGQFFDNFSQVSDQEVLAILRETVPKPASAARGSR